MNMKPTEGNLVCGFDTSQYPVCPVGLEDHVDTAPDASEDLRRNILIPC